MYIIYGLTLSVMYFVYGTIVLLILLIAMINIQPLKMINSKYPLADLLFAFLLTITQIAVQGRVIDNIEKYLYFHTAMTLIALLSAFVPLLYISYLIGSWLLSKITFHVYDACNHHIFTHRKTNIICTLRHSQKTRFMYVHTIPTTISA